ncbi:MAG TPA: DUF5050 domain-containing protein [Anaerolineae bacterium]|nr:DUF5050 domain-containing protein [Anaerolineae bacterium]
MLRNKQSKLFSVIAVIFILAFGMTQCQFPNIEVASIQPTIQETILLPETPASQPEEVVKSTPTVLPLIEPTPLKGQIVFVSNRDGNDEIYVMNADGSQQIRLTYNTWPDSSPVWSPDGQRIAYVSYVDENFEIYIMGADGKQQTRLTNNTAFDAQISWSPNGEFIVFVSGRDSNDEIYVMKADGSQQTRITNHPAIDGSPAWSFDGEYIVFSSTRDNREDVVFVNSALYMMKADGSQLVSLTDSLSSNTSPVWSPDGKYIAFVSDRDSLRGRVPKIYLMEMSTREITRLTDDDMAAYPVSHEFAPAWSPDGQYLAFTLDDGVPQIYAVHLQSGQMFQLTDGNARNYLPHWWAP